MNHQQRKREQKRFKRSQRDRKPTTIPGIGDTIKTAQRRKSEAKGMRIAFWPSYIEDYHAYNSDNPKSRSNTISRRTKRKSKARAALRRPPRMKDPVALTVKENEKMLKLYSSEMKEIEGKKPRYEQWLWRKIRIEGVEV